MAAARALMQQGLRHCRADEGLWGEYLRMELLYVARLRARREVLGLPNPGVCVYACVCACVCMGFLIAHVGR